MFFDSGDFAAIVVMMIPVSTVTMTFIAIILRMIFRQRAIERVMRARIAAIERGVDPTQLPTTI